MNLIRKIAVFIGLMIVFLFALNVNEIRINTIQTEKSNSAFSNDSNHSSFFIQPQANISFIFNGKTANSIIAKWFENFLIKIPDFKILNLSNTFVNQDINRCEMVSILLFPFHYFW